MSNKTKPTKKRRKVKQTTQQREAQINKEKRKTQTNSPTERSSNQTKRSMPKGIRISYLATRSTSRIKKAANPTTKTSNLCSNWFTEEDLGTKAQKQPIDTQGSTNSITK